MSDRQRQPTDLFQLEHVLFPALRRHLVPPKSLLKNKNVTQIADLPDLYKTFERC
jgi:DNA mismatch repair protein MLH1